MNKRNARTVVDELRSLAALVVAEEMSGRVLLEYVQVMQHEAGRELSAASRGAAELIGRVRPTMTPAMVAHALSLVAADLDIARRDGGGTERGARAGDAGHE